MSHQLFKSTAIVISMPRISRILGFVRDMLITHILGIDVATDAFFAAFKIHNFYGASLQKARLPVLLSLCQLIIRAGKQIRNTD